MLVIYIPIYKKVQEFFNDASENDPYCHLVLYLFHKVPIDPQRIVYVYALML